MKNNLKNRQGISTLVLVFTIATLLAMVIFVLYLTSLLAARRASQIRYSQTAFFAAEGALYETIQHLRDYSYWPDFSGGNDYHDEYQIGETTKTTIKRTITKLNGDLQIDIHARVKNAKRSLSATFTRREENPTPVDIFLIIDRSGSMGELDVLPGDPPQPIADTLNAAIAFIEVIEEAHQPGADREGVADRIGIVTYSTNAEVYKSLGIPFDQLKAALDPATNIGINILIEGWTNIGGSLYFAKKELFEDDPHPNPDVHQAIVLLTDGCANMAFEEPEGDPPVLIPDPNNDGCETWPGESWAPADWPTSNTECTRYAKQKAIEAKNEEAVIFSIGLLGYLDADHPEAADYSRHLLGENIASQPEYFKDVYESGDLVEIYEKIAKAIISPEFFKYQEELPEPD